MAKRTSKKPTNSSAASRSAGTTSAGSKRRQQSAVAEQRRLAQLAFDLFPETPLAQPGLNSQSGRTDQRSSATTGTKRAKRSAKPKQLQMEFTTTAARKADRPRKSPKPSLTQHDPVKDRSPLAGRGEAAAAKPVTKEPIRQQRDDDVSRMNPARADRLYRELVKKHGTRMPEGMRDYAFALQMKALEAPISPEELARENERLNRRETIEDVLNDPCRPRPVPNREKPREDRKAGASGGSKREFVPWSARKDLKC